HHIRFVQPRALGRKASDEFAVPLCRSHHRAVHRAGDEKVWWKQAGIDPIQVARKLWKHTRIDEGRIEPELTARGAAADHAKSDGLVVNSQTPAYRPLDMLNDIMRCDDLFHTATGTAFADIKIDGHRETWPIRSKRFRAWLRRRYYQAT